MKLFLIIVLACSILGKLNDIIEHIATRDCEGDVLTWHALVIACYILSLAFIIHLL